MANYGGCCFLLYDVPLQDVSDHDSPQLHIFSFRISGTRSYHVYIIYMRIIIFSFVVIFTKFWSLYFLTIIRCLSIRVTNVNSYSFVFLSNICPLTIIYSLWSVNSWLVNNFLFLPYLQYFLWVPNSSSLFSSLSAQSTNVLFISTFFKNFTLLTFSVHVILSLLYGTTSLLHQVSSVKKLIFCQKQSGL